MTEERHVHCCGVPVITAMSQLQHISLLRPSKIAAQQCQLLMNAGTCKHQQILDCAIASLDGGCAFLIIYM
jgi:hypothetical protein